MKIYFDPKLASKSNYIRLVKRYPNVEFISDLSRAKEVEVLIPFNPNLVSDINVHDYPNLKWIQYFSAGFDGVDLDHIKNHGVIFTNAQDVYSKAIAEDVFTKILYFNRCVKHCIDSMNSKIWKSATNHRELTNSIVLILGVGSIGKELAKRFKSFEMKVIGFRRNQKQENNFDEIITLDSELDEALTIADYVVLALPLNEHTQYMFDKSKLDLMKNDALLVNVARGKVVNQDDLYYALKNKRIRGAGLDVFDPEPLPINHPLWELDNVFITPHNASSSNLMMDNLFDLFITNLDLYISGKPVKYRIV
jgi:phosphoglycerate dehydrogenase-like enzyme